MSQQRQLLIYRVYLDNCDQLALVALVTGENATDDPTPDVTTQMGDN